MSGFSNFARNKLIDFYHRGQALTPAATVYIALVSTTPNAGSAGTPLAGTGYARVAVAGSMAAWSGTQGGASTVASSGTSGTTSNNATVDFGTAGAAWGTASHFEVWDSLTGGNRLYWGEITDGAGTPTPRAIVLGDPVSFPAGSLQINWA